MEREAKVSTWLGVAASAIAVLAFFGIRDYDQLQRALDGDSADSPQTGLEEPGTDAGAGAGWNESEGSSTGSSGSIGDSGGDSGGGDDQWSRTLTPDPTLAAYQAVDVGDCLHNWMTGQSSWSTEAPEVIACGAEGAALWVSLVSDTPSSCPSDAGRHHLSYTSDEGETVALCVTRRFQIGQCFLGMPDGSANLMSWVDCQGSGVPAPYSQKYNVTGIYTAQAQHTPDECSRSLYDQTRYVSWFVDGDTLLVCAVVYTG